MSETNRNFWDHYNEQKKPIHHFFTDRSPESAHTFIASCNTVYQHLNAMQPEAVIFPARSIIPVSWAINKIEDVNQVEMRSWQDIILPVGVMTDLKGKRHGSVYEDKMSDITKRMLSFIPENSKAVLVDEVVSGSRILSIIDMIQTVRPDLNLNIIGMEHRDRERKDDYLQIRKRSNFTAIQSDLILTDRNSFLDNLLIDAEAVEHSIFLPHYLHNTQMRYLVEQLVQYALQSNTDDNVHQTSAETLSAEISYLLEGKGKSLKPIVKELVHRWFNEYDSICKLNPLAL